MVSLADNNLERWNPANMIDRDLGREKTRDTHLKRNLLGVGKRPMSPSLLEAKSDTNPKTPDTSSTGPAQPGV